MKIKLTESSRTRGVVLSMATLAFYRSPAIPIDLTIGYDAKTKKEFLYIEIRNEEDSAYASPQERDYCLYNSLQDESISAPFLHYFFRIFSKYKIFIPIEIYEILQDAKLRNPASVSGYRGLVEDISNLVADEYKADPSQYYKYFYNLVDYSVDYLDPLELLPIRPVADAVSESSHSLIKNRLMLGEANFAFSNAFCAKHKDKPSLLKRIVATEYMPEDQIAKAYDDFTSHIKALSEYGVEVKYGIDATNIHNLFSGKKFKYIHFNCPHDRSGYKARTLPLMLKNFFLSASQLQNIGDRIYMALPEEKDSTKKEFRESYIYKIYDAAAEAGYKLVKKRQFGPKRYPGYEHRITGKAESARVAQEIREYIFLRIEPLEDLPEMIHYKSPTVGKENFKGQPGAEFGHLLPEDIHTDDDSSAYDSDSESEAAGPAPAL